MNNARDVIGEALSRRFRPYPVYKDSGFEWLGEIPAHWRTVPIKRVCRLCYGDSLAADDRANGEVMVFGSNGPVGTHDCANTKAPCLVVGRKGSFGKVNFSSEAVFAIDTTFFTDVRYTEEDLRWLFYTLKSARLDTTSRDSAIPGLDRNDAHVRTVAKCPIHEQRTIAAFLDRETAKIDRLVARKERLIELLQEKRNALIAQAVTRGLDPTRETRATGSHVFTSVPRGLTLWKIRHLIRQVRRPLALMRDASYQEIGIRSWGKGIFHKEPVIGAQVGEKNVFRIEPGDLVLNIVFAWEGAVAVVSKRETGMIASHRFPTFRASDHVDVDYLLMVLKSDQGRALMELNSPGAAGRNKTLRIGQFLDEEIPLPSIEHQRAIVAAFSEQERRLSALAARIHQAIELLKEYRTALISAAVTGKIDVRGAVPK